MSLIRYNGVQLNIVKLHKFECKPVMTADGVDSLYNHYIIAARCVVNAAATSDGGNPLGQSMAELKRKLTQHRKQLVFAVGGFTVLSSPQSFSVAGGPSAAAVVDAANGPQVVYCNFMEISGTKTAILEFCVETWIKDCSNATSSVIGHRWEMSHDIDKQFLTTRTVSGTVVCRSDGLRIAGLTPDDFRSKIAHPIPKNFQRSNVQVTQRSDGVTLDYSFTDEEQWLNRGIDSPIVEVAGFYENELNCIGNLTPTLTASIVVEAWGSKKAKRTDMANAVTKAAASYGFAKDGPIVYWMNVAAGIDIVKKYARLRAQVVLSNAASLMVGGALSAFGASSPIRPNLRELPEDLGDLATAADGDNPRPAQSGVRGNYLAQALAQVLTAPCSDPAVPVEPPLAKIVA